MQLSSSGLVYPVATLGSISGVKNVNALLNGCFQIAQVAGPWSLTGTIFSHLADLWQGTAGTGGAATVSLNNFLITDGSIGAGSANVLRWNQTTPANDNPKLRSRIESVATLAGQAVTVSFCAVATSAITISANLSQNFGSGGSTAVATTATSFSVTTVRSRLGFTTTLPSLGGKTLGMNDSLDVVFNLPSGIQFQLDIDSVECVIGTTPSFIVPPPTEHVLSSCLRYLYRLSGGAGQMIGSGRASAASTGQVFVLFPVPMRIPPVLAGYNDLLLNAAAATAAVLNGVGVNGATLELTGTVAAGTSAIAKLNSTSSFVLFDARMPLT